MKQGRNLDGEQGGVAVGGGMVRHWWRGGLFL